MTWRGCLFFGRVPLAPGGLSGDYNSLMKPARVAVLALAVVAAFSSAAQQTPAPTPEPTRAGSSLVPSPAEEHVVAPSLPDQPNREGVARPSGSMPTDSEGYVRTNRGAVDPSAATPTPSTGVVAVTGAGTASTVVSPTPPPGPRGPSEVKAAYLSLSGTVKAFAKGVSITIVEKDGVERTVKLAAKASVYDGLAAGDKVVLRVPLRKNAEGMSTDRISRQKPPKAPPKSKFSAAQSPVR